jgi:hypothetical protein
MPAHGLFWGWEASAGRVRRVRGPESPKHNSNDGEPSLDRELIINERTSDKLTRTNVKATRKVRKNGPSFRTVPADSTRYREERSRPARGRVSPASSWPSSLLMVSIGSSYLHTDDAEGGCNPRIGNGCTNLARQIECSSREACVQRPDSDPIRRLPA